MDKQELLKDLYTAVAESDFKRIKSIIKNNPELLKHETPNGSWLHVAARINNIDIIEYFINLGLDINQKGGFSKSMPIDLAVSEGNIEVVKYFLKKGAIFDESAPERNPLFAAIHKGNLEILKLLVKNGIKTNVQYKEKTALSFAKQMGNDDIVKYLMELEEKS
jgi:uncharacterized protein